MATKAKTSKSFPFKNVPVGQKIDISKIRNPLDPKKLANPTVLSIAEIVASLEQHPATMTYINALKANKKTFNVSHIGKFVSAPIGSVTFNEITQRLIDPVHCHNDILTKLDPRLLSPVFATKQKNNTNSCFDTMHGIGVVGLLAKHGLWGNDAKDWLNFKFPAFIVDEPYPSFTPEAALHRNGKGQKKWEPYDHHKIKVAAVRQHNNTNKEYVEAEAKQSLCELLEAVPVPTKHPDFGKAGTLPRVDVLDDWDFDSLFFILNTHKTYWHGTLIDSAVWGLYGNLIGNMQSSNFPTKGKDWDIFLNEFNAIINECFADLANLRTVTSNAYTRYFRKAHPMLKTVPTCPHNAALAIVMKIYREVGGTYFLTGDVNDYMQNGCDIYNELDNDILEIIKNAKV